MKTYTIREISKRFDLPASTLRYYEEMGLLTGVERDSNNQRIYNDDHLGQLYAINCFKRTGMSITKIHGFIELSKDIEQNIDEIQQLLEEHERSIQQQLAKMQDDLMHIQHKIRYYNGIREAINHNEPWPEWEDFEKNNELTNEESFQVFNAISEVFPMIIYANLTQNTYAMLKHDNFLAGNIPFTGCYDDLIDWGVENIHENYQKNFIQCFDRENLIQAYSQGKTDVYAELYQKGHDDKYQWVSTHVIRTNNEEGEICQICINRILDGVEKKAGGSRR